MPSNLLFYRLKNNLANFITLLNLTAGILALKFLFEGNYETAFYLVLAGIFFDFIDGLIARATRTSSEMGLQLDSLADLVTSGVVPGFFLYRLWQETFPQADKDVALIALLIPVASAWRLAKFNIDPRQKKHFIGLPTPANALVLLSIGMLILKFPESRMAAFFTRPVVVTITVLVSAWLLNAGIPLLSLKSGGEKAHKPLKIILVLVSAVLFVLFSFRAVPFILLFYILLSLYAFKIRTH